MNVTLQTGSLLDPTVASVLAFFCGIGALASLVESYFRAKTLSTQRSLALAPIAAQYATSSFPRYTIFFLQIMALLWFGFVFLFAQFDLAEKRAWVHLILAISLSLPFEAALVFLAAGAMLARRLSARSPWLLLATPPAAALLFGLSFAAIAVIPDLATTLHLEGDSIVSQKGRSTIYTGANRQNISLTGFLLFTLATVQWLAIVIHTRARSKQRTWSRSLAEAS